MHDNRIFIAGGSGFLGKVLVSRFKEKGYANVRVGGKESYDLTTLDGALTATEGCDLVINLAGLVTSRRDQEKRPQEILRVNVLTNLQILEACKRNGVEKVISVGSSTAYADALPSLLRTEDLFSGAVPKIKGKAGFYGIAKWLTSIAGRSYAMAGGMKVRVPVFPNLYGPEDKFEGDPPPLVANLIRSLVEAKKRGDASYDAGKNPLQGMDLLYVGDAAGFIIRIMEQFGDEEFLCTNAGSGRSATIEEICGLIARQVQFDGTIVWADREGKGTRVLDNGEAGARYGWAPEVTLEEGIKRTMEWFTTTYGKKD